MQTDEFTHTAAGYPVIDHSWASGVVMYLIFSHFGPEGIRILAAVLAGLVAFLLTFWLSGLGIDHKAGIVAVFLTLSMMMFRWPDRPELFSYFFLLTILVIDAHKKKRPKLIWLLPLVIWLWSIFYGVGVLAGLGLTLLLAIKSRQKVFIALALACIPVAFLNGYGSDTVFYFFRYIPQVSQYDAEWIGALQLQVLPPLQANIFKPLINVFMAWLVGIMVLGFMSFRLKLGQRFWVILGMLAALAPLQAFRQLPNAAILAAPLIGWTKINRYFFAGIFLVALGLFVYWRQVLPAHVDPGVDRSFYQMVDFIRDQNLQGKAFNHVSLGGKLTYYLYPQILVFYDTRDDLFIRSRVWDDLYPVFVNGESILPILDRYKVDLVIGDMASDNLNYAELFNTPDWGVVWQNDRYFLALRKPQILTLHLSEVPIDPYLPGGLLPNHLEEGLAYYQQLQNKNPSQLNSQLFSAALQFYKQR